MANVEPGRPAVDADRLWDSIMAMAKIGATPKGGSCRAAAERRGVEVEVTEIWANLRYMTVPRTSSTICRSVDP